MKDKIKELEMKIKLQEKFLETSRTHITLLNSLSKIRKEMRDELIIFGSLGNSDSLLKRESEILSLIEVLINENWV